jgi:hypothetical protein
MTCRHCEANNGVRIVALITNGESVVAPVAVTCSHMSDKDWHKTRRKPKPRPVFTLIKNPD